MLDFLSLPLTTSLQLPRLNDTNLAANKLTTTLVFDVFIVEIEAGIDLFLFSNMYNI